MAAAGLRHPVRSRRAGRGRGVQRPGASIPRFCAGRGRSRELAAREPPDAAVLIDAWGFSLRVARGIRRLAPGRADHQIRRAPGLGDAPGAGEDPRRAPSTACSRSTASTRRYFEARGPADHLRRQPGRWRGTFSAADGPGFRRRHGYRARRAAAPRASRVAGPARSGAWRRRSGRLRGCLARRRPDLAVVVAAAETVESEVRAAVAAGPSLVVITTGEADRLSAMKAATAALACSGTVTTELALAGCPFVVGYRMDPADLRDRPAAHPHPLHHPRERRGGGARGR